MKLIDLLFSGGKPKKEAAAEDVQTATVDAETVPEETVAENAGSGEAVVTEPEAASATAQEATDGEPAEIEAEYTADEHVAWIRYLRDPRRAFRRAGLSVGEEFKLWQAARAEYKAMLARNQPPE